MKYALLLSTMLIAPSLAFATNTTSPADTSSTDPSTTTTSTDPSSQSTDMSSNTPSTSSGDTSQIQPQTNLSSTMGSAPADSWGSFKVGDVSYQATVIYPPGDSIPPYELLFATNKDGTTTPYIFALTPPSGSVPPVASNLPADNTGNSSGSTDTSNTDNTSNNTGGVTNNGNVVHITKVGDYQLTPVNGSGSTSSTGSTGSTDTSSNTPPSLTDLKNRLVAQEKAIAKTTDNLLTEINNELNTPTPLPAVNTNSGTQTTGTQTAANP